MEILRKIDLFQKEIHALRPMEGEMLGQIQEYYRIGLTWTSNALEGNSLTESETKVLLEDGLTVGGKPLRDVFEAVDAGRYRDVRVLITGSQYPVAVPEKIQREMDSLFAWVQKEREGYHPVEFAAQLHKRFVFIHPFKDGNGRVARLLMNLALIQDGYLPVVVPPILRGDYVSLLERAHRDDGDFMEFIAEREFESQKEILRLFQIPFPKEGQEQGMGQSPAMQ